MQISFFDNTIEKFIKNLEPKIQARVLRTLELLEKFGRQLKMPHSKKVFQNIFELRTHGKQEIRLFYLFQKEKIVVLHGFIKKSQKIPKKEIEKTLAKAGSLTGI